MKPNSSLIMTLRSRFPSYKKNLSVYAVIVILLYGWTLRWLGWKLPSWLHYLTGGEISIMFAYAFATVFLESLFVLAVLNIFTALLPKAWFLESFIVNGTLLCSSGLGYLMYFASQFKREADIHIKLLYWFPVVLLGTLFLSFLVRKVGILVEFIEKLADRLIVFLYLLVPLGFLSLFIILFRNLI